MFSVKFNHVEFNTDIAALIFPLCFFLHFYWLLYSAEKSCRVWLYTYQKAADHVVNVTFVVSVYYISYD